MDKVDEAMAEELLGEEASEGDGLVVHPADGEVRLQLGAEAGMARAVGDGTDLQGQGVGTEDGLRNEEKGRF